MPELPEVETTCRGIAPHIESHRISKVTIRNPKLRWPIPKEIKKILQGEQIHQIYRRAKYLLFKCDSGSLIIHLGMSGHLQIVDDNKAIGKHDHADFQFDNGLILRYTDPRRFGAILWTDDDINQHPLFKNLGPEPLSDKFNSDYLCKVAKGRRVTIKTFIMNGNNVVGVGNIYANEALFLAKIHPKTAAGKLDSKQYKKLVTAIKLVLDKAISAGGTTLKDFRKSDGKPGYFAQQLSVYGRENKPCIQCSSDIVQYKEAQRATYFCPQCQIL
jgi:formamidopyrimidine-DNA glycosylase